jgi:hypothetical protein
LRVGADGGVSDFINHMSGIDSFQVYAHPEIRDEVREEIQRSF